MEQTTNPIRMLRQQATRLEAAIAVSVASPTRNAVHELRSETRRIEALLDLLRRMRGLPPYRTAAEKLRRRLNKLRRVAGDVRDCDVQRKLLKKPAEIDARNEAPDELQDDKDKLRKILRRRRRRAERILQHSLRRQGAKLARGLEAVLDAVKAQENTDVEAEDLLKPIERGLARIAGFRQADEKRLHNLRKAAKQARYQCEALSGAQAAALAKQLEELQDAGGKWHDLLLLAEHAADELGADHPLARVLERSRDEHLDRYVERLEAFRNRHRAAAASVPRKGVQAERNIRGASRSSPRKMAA